MKRKLSLGILFFFIILSVSATSFEDSGFHISAAPLYSFEFGQLDEFVFSKDFKNIDYKLSELNWDVRNHSIGLSADFGWKWISVGTTLIFGLSSESGSMLDSDWQNNFDHSMKTNFSISENTLNKFSNFEFILKGIIPVTPESKADIFTISVIPSLIYNYAYYNFSANNAEGWYGTTKDTGLSYIVPYDSENAKHYEKGTLCGIDYIREYNKIFIGAGVDFSFIKKINLFVNFDISVYSLINSLDTHYSDMNKYIGKKYLDKMQGTFQTMRFSASLNYNFYKEFYICADYLFTYQALTQGITYVSYSLTNSSYELLKGDYSGSAASTHRFSIYVKLALGNKYFLY